MPPAARPPAAAPADLLALADRCVQCGLCLPACPTYGLARIEAESPRGRIALARAWELATVPPSASGDRHLDHCLGCRNCEAVCPAGVRYGELLVAARSRQRERRPPGWQQRGAEWFAARPVLLGALLRVYRWLHPWLPPGFRVLPRPPRPRRPPIAGAQTGIAIFSGCVARAYEAGLRAAVARLGAAAGFAVQTPRAQGCCGALHAHAGNLHARDRLAARNRAAFVGCETVLTLASGCHEAVAASLAGAAPVRDALDFLQAHADRLHFRDCRERVALHLPCTQRNVVKSVAAVRALLARVPGLDVIELDAGYGCCGAAGTAMLREPQRAAAYRQPLLDQLAASGATRLLSANIGCRLHLANGTTVPVLHPLEFLAGCLAPASDAAATTPRSEPARSPA